MTEKIIINIGRERGLKMAIAKISLKEFRRTINLYEDVICLFYREYPTGSLDGTITERISEIISKTYELTDSLVKLVRIDITNSNSSNEQKRLNILRIDLDDCPTVCYFKNSNLVEKHTKTFTQHLLNS